MDCAYSSFDLFLTLADRLYFGLHASSSLRDLNARYFSTLVGVFVVFKLLLNGECICGSIHVFRCLLNHLFQLVNYSVFRQTIG